MSVTKGRRSLASRFLSIVVVTELAFGIAAVAVVSGYTLRQSAAEHERTRRVLSTALSASLVGEMRGPDRTGLAAAADALMAHVGATDIVEVRVYSPGDEVLYTSGSRPADAVRAGSGGLSDFTQASIQRTDIMEGARRLGSLEITYGAIGLGAVIGFPLAVIIVLAAVAIVFSSLWTTWLMSRTIGGPVASLRDAAAAISEGRRVPLPVERADELGDLARGIAEMMEQLDQREEELKDSYRSLEAAYNRQAILKGELESALRTRSDFVAVASHEIRSPLAVIRMYAEMLQEGEYGPLADAQGEAAGAISAASSRLTSIVADLMDVALLERGLMPLTYGEVELDVLAEEAVRDRAAVGGGAGVELALEPGGPVVVHGDELRLRQVLDNLLDNAIKYAGGAPVAVSVVRGADAASVRIADRGPGIPEDRRAELFEMFRRVESGDDSAASGLGLGLAISRRIVAAHGGSIEVEENVEAGRGTVFAVRLPYHRDEDDAGPSSISVV